jgi:uncharacterized protein
VSLYDEDMRKPLRPKRLSARLRGLAPRPVSLITSLVLIASIGTIGFIMRHGSPDAGEPIVRMNMPRLETQTAAITPPAIEDLTQPPDNDEYFSGGLEPENPDLAPLPSDEPLTENFGETIVQEVVGVEPERNIRLAKAPIPGLWEKGPQGPLPRISPNGRKPAYAYARPVTKQALQGPRIVLIIGGLGLNEGLSQRAIKLPGEITLALAPYGKRLQNLADQARRDGHELLLQLPMEPIGYPRIDPGPNTLLSGRDATGNPIRLQWLLSRFQGYFGVTNYLGSRFLQDKNALNATKNIITGRGVAWIIPPNAASIDSPDRAMVMRYLNDLEKQAARNGIAVGIGTGLDVTLDALEEWVQGLESRGVHLVPASSLLGGSASLMSAQ